MKLTLNCLGDVARYRANKDPVLERRKNCVKASERAGQEDQRTPVARIFAELYRNPVPCNCLLSAGVADGGVRVIFERIHL